MLSISKTTKAFTVVVGATSVADSAELRAYAERPTTHANHVVKAENIKPAPGSNTKRPPLLNNFDGYTDTSVVALLQPPPAKEKTVGDLKKEREAKKAELKQIAEEKLSEIAQQRGAAKDPDDRTITEDAIGTWLKRREDWVNIRTEVADLKYVLDNCRIKGKFKEFPNGATNKQRDAIERAWLEKKDLPDIAKNRFEKAEAALKAAPNQDLVGRFRRSFETLDATVNEYNQILEAEQQEKK